MKCIIRSSTTTTPSTASQDNAEAEDPRTKQKLYLQFTCTHEGDCTQPNEESRIVRKMISKIAYEEGVTLVRCPCEKLHLVSDRLGWFSEDHTSQTDIVRILEEKGERLRLSSPDYLDSSRASPGGGKQKGSELLDVT